MPGGRQGLSTGLVVPPVQKPPFQATRFRLSTPHLKTFFFSTNSASASPVGITLSEAPRHTNLWPCERTQPRRGLHQLKDRHTDSGTVPLTHSFPISSSRETQLMRQMGPHQWSGLGAARFLCLGTCYTCPTAFGAEDAFM